MITSYPDLDGAPFPLFHPPRSSSDMADEISMPADYKKLEARNAPDVRVYEFARELQALDVLLFSFVQVRVAGQL